MLLGICASLDPKHPAPLVPTCQRDTQQNSYLPLTSYPPVCHCQLKKTKTDLLTSLHQLQSQGVVVLVPFYENNLSFFYFYYFSLFRVPKLNVVICSILNFKISKPGSFCLSLPISHKGDLWLQQIYGMLTSTFTSSPHINFLHFAMRPEIFSTAIKIFLCNTSVHKSACAASGSAANAGKSCHRLPGQPPTKGLLNYNLVCQCSKNNSVPSNLGCINRFPMSGFQPFPCLEYLGVILDTA